jgi:hypothetical protein
MINEEPYELHCGDNCGHHDVINQCCWIVSDRGLCSEVEEGDPCLYGFVELNGMILSPLEIEKTDNYRNWGES